MKNLIGILTFATFLGFAEAGRSADIELPSDAPPIISDFDSMWGANRLPRPTRHQGIDISGPRGMAILAAADGVVRDVEVAECWGPTVVIDHGPGVDGEPLIALYGHLGHVSVLPGQKVMRGQQIASLGDNHGAFRCIVGIRHLHFQLGREWRSGPKGTFWGHVRFLVDGKTGVDPHLYWADGPGRVTCFEPDVFYRQGTLTYPMPCN